MRTEQTPDTPLLETCGISKHFTMRDSRLRRLRGQPAEVLRAVDKVSLRVYAGETVALVGESGCGKSTFGRLLVRLHEPSAGEIYHNGINILGHDPRAMRELRTKIQIIFQDPYSSLNPRKTVRQALQEVLKVHKICPPAERRARADALLEMVGLSPDMADRKPHQFSGGQRQRIGIARALAVGPDFIVADEPISALDVSVQAQVLNLLQQLQERLGLTYLFISHNLSVVRHISRRVAVMYLGNIVEQAPSDDLFVEPLHPYTQALLRAIPTLNPDQTNQGVALEGDPPNAIRPPSGCHFHPRCPFAMPICSSVYPEARRVAPDRTVACHLYTDMGTTPPSGTSNVDGNIRSTPAQ